MKVGPELNSYEDFESAFKDICNANNWTFVKHDSKSEKIANKELKSDSQLYSAKFRYRYVRFRCKHGGSTRKKGRVYDQINGKPILHLYFYILVLCNHDRAGTASLLKHDASTVCLFKLHC